MSTTSLAPVEVAASIAGASSSSTLRTSTGTCPSGVAGDGFPSSASDGLPPIGAFLSFAAAPRPSGGIWVGVDVGNC